MKKKLYEPPFTVSAKTINLIAEISAELERFKIRLEQTDGILLRKVNRMQTIHGSLAIEGNTLTEEQVTALLNGKKVIASPNEIQEVKNAINAYDHFMEYDPYDYKSLLKAHSLMAVGLVKNPGHFRKGGVCVAGKNGISHIAPPADRVSLLINDLFEWVKKAEDHILIKSCVFHYEFEFIHPFEDGNGRMGRFWQSRILAQWNEVFAHLPIENMIWEHQKEYYKAIEKSTDENDSGIFVEFMLSIILESLRKHNKSDNVKDNVNDNVKLTQNQKEIIKAIKNNPFVTQQELSEKIGMTVTNISRNMKKLQEYGIIKRIGADKNGHWKVLKKTK